jgi:hypothetical protein
MPQNTIMQRIAASYGPDNLGLESRQGQIFFLLQNAQTGFGAHTASYFMGTGDFCRGLSGRGVKLTTRLHLVSRLRMSGAISLILFMAWKGTTLPLRLPCTYR